MPSERTILTFMLVAHLLCAISKVNGQADSSQGVTFKDLAYKKSPDGRTLTLDIFLPDSTPHKRFPAVVIIHGGGWVEGDKTLETIYYMQKLRDELIKNSYAVVSINYSLVGADTHFPTPVKDCKDAIKWLKQHSGDYNLDTTNFGLWGGSAGGQLALLTAYSPDDQFVGEPALTSYSARVNYVIDNFGPTDLGSLFKIGMSKFSIFLAKLFYKKIYRIREKLVFAITGFNIKTDKEKVRAALSIYSPLEYVNQTSIPTMIFHGTKDKVVPIDQSHKLHNKLDEFNISNSFTTVEKGDHGFNNLDKAETDQLVEKVIELIKAHTK